MNIYFNKYVTLIFNLKNYGHVTRNYPIHVIALVFSSIFSCGEELFNFELYRRRGYFCSFIGRAPVEKIADGGQPRYIRFIHTILS